MPLDRELFLSELRSLAQQNIRWLHQGRDPSTGFDCIGCARYAVERQGFQLPEELAKEFEHYLRPPDGQRFLSILRKWFIEIPKEEIQPADLMVLFNRKNPCHLVIKMEEDLIAEAYESIDGSVSNFLIRPLDPRHRIAACFRIPEFD